MGTIREHKGESLLLFPDSYVVVDIETTGLDARYDEIVEICGIKYDKGAEVGSFQSLIKPENEIDEFITELTGITNEMVKDAPSIQDVLPQFLNFIGEFIIVGHNVNFDINFLYDDVLRYGFAPLSNNFVDTMRISRRLYKDFPNHKLSTLVAELGVGEDVKHRAFSDCEQTNQCFLKMKAYAEQIGGIPMPDKAKWNTLSKDIHPETTDFNPDSPIFRRVFVFTGKLEQMTRREAMQAVVNAGGGCGDNVTAATNYLVLGNNDYCSTIKNGKSNKQKKAEKMQLAVADITTISEDVFYDMLATN